MNIFIALTLGSHIFPGRHAPTKLTEDNVNAFIREWTTISNGQRRDMDAYSIAGYLMQHIADQGEFKTTIRYNIDDVADNSRDLTLTKTTYISDLLEGLKHSDAEGGRPTIEYVTIDQDGRNATAMVDIPERGILPVTDATGEKNMMLVAGTSYCEQHIALNTSQVIQLTAANCTTDLALADSP